MDNEDTMNLEDTDYMSGDELMDQNPDEDEVVVVEDTLMSTSKNRRKRGGLLHHMKVYSLNLVPGTPGTGRMIDQLVFHEMIAVALIEHNLPYSFVEYTRVREALAYANPTIEFWCRNTWWRWNTWKHWHLQAFYAFFSQSADGSGKSALDKYLDEPVLDIVANLDLDVLSY
ncbi:hypothetical protein Bca4012_003236 [Brassica carinata]